MLFWQLIVVLLVQWRSLISTEQSTVEGSISTEASLRAMFPSCAYCTAYKKKKLNHLPVSESINCSIPGMGVGASRLLWLQPDMRGSDHGRWEQVDSFMSLFYLHRCNGHV